MAVVGRKSATALDVQRHVAYAISWSLLLILGDGLTLPFLGFIALTVALLTLCDSGKCRIFIIFKRLKLFFEVKHLYLCGSFKNS